MTVIDSDQHLYETRNRRFKLNRFDEVLGKALRGLAGVPVAVLAKEGDELHCLVQNVAGSFRRSWFGTGHVGILPISF